MSEGFKAKFAVLFGLLTSGYLIFLFLSTFKVNVVYFEPEGCQKIMSLSPQHYDSVEYIATIRLKNKAKKVGANTLYVPRNFSNVINKNKIITGVAYDCPNT